MTHDTALARDAALPHRDALLDGAAVARALGVARCERTYAKYRVGESLRVVHRTGDGAHVAGRSFPDAAAAYARALPLAAPVGPRPGVVLARELGAVLWTFPNDRRLAALPLLAGPGEALERLAGRPCAGTRLVAYAAERSATAACLDADGRVAAFAKVHAGDGAARERRATAAVHAALGDGSPHLRVPRLLGEACAHTAPAADEARANAAPSPGEARAPDALALEALPGRRLDALRAGEQPFALRALGRALATLHGLEPPPGARFARLDPARLARAVGAIATARPPAGRAAAELLSALLGRHADAAGRAVCLHGDANPRNALLDGDRVSLIDLEDAAAGPAAADLGHVLAGLLCARVGGELPAAAEPELAGALLRGYADLAPAPPPEALAWHTAASVLARRALTAVSRVRDPDLRRLDGYLRAAGALVR
jgi:hypothetical protein